MRAQLVFIVFISTLISFSSCNNNNSKTESTEKKVYQPLNMQPDTTIYVVLDDSLRQVFTTRGKQITIRAQNAIKSELQKAIKEGGLEYALEFCNVIAMPITDSLSINEKVQIKRLAKKYRNPLNETDTNESMLYKSYVINWISGMPLHPMVFPGENNHPVFFEPIKVESVCLNCHGTVGEQINPGVAKKIAELYPNDKAIDFKTGELRGMWSITFLDYVITDVK